MCEETCSVRKSRASLVPQAAGQGGGMRTAKHFWVACDAMKLLLKVEPVH